MSEKRFEYDKCTGIKDLSIDENNDQFLYPTQIVDLLNELNDENKKLKRMGEMGEKRFVYEEEHFPIALQQIKDNWTGKTYDLEECCDLLNEQYSFISYLLVENEEYEEESEDMQTKINVLYHEAKKHMSSTEWEKFNRRIIESEEELGIKWVRI